jgi:tRNASer (uridine44-2'-O)-methyltransferase
MSPSPIDPDTVSEVSQKMAKSTISTSSASSSDPSKFQPIDRSNTKPDIELSSDETWLTILETPCTFGAKIFEEVMLNFIKNPNVTSSYLFRADILHDTESEQSGTGLDQNISPDSGDHKPRTFDLPGWKQDRVIVRLLIPRNQQLDRPLVQTCILLSKEKSTNEDLEENLVVYIPHTSSPEETPFYHPRVAKLAFHHTFRPTMNSNSSTTTQSNDKNNTNGPTHGTGTLSLSYSPFQSSPDIDSKLQRTGLKLLQTIHKHGQGQLGGYKKRVHHDRLIPQKSYQDTYARLKAKYGRKLSEGWVEVTDPSKHVFEDLGIAAFCLELWQQMYQVPETAKGEQREQQATGGAEDVADHSTGGEAKAKNDTGNQKPPFPGFVDIGCGNGLLVYILISEGYPGFGFDARERKTWETFPSQVRQHLRQSLLVPEILRPNNDNDGESTTVNDTSIEDAAKSWHSGLFTPGTFIISNHADELTAWTPLLAYLNKSAFIAIPCCSHDLAGSRFRAPDSTKAQKARQTAAKKEEKFNNGQQRNEHAARLPQQESSSCRGESNSNSGPDPSEHDLRLSQAAETGSLKRTLVHKKMASAYSTLCAYVSALAEAVGFEAEEEVLRIPSTRNASIVGRKRRVADGDVELEERGRRVVELVEEELGRMIENVGREWIERAERLEKKPGSGH